MDENIYADLEKRYCHYDDEDMETMNKTVDPEPRQRKQGKLFGLLAFAGMASELGSQKKSPRFRVGEHVGVCWRSQEETIIDINGGLYMGVLLDETCGSGGFIAGQINREVTWNEQRSI